MLWDYASTLKRMLDQAESGRYPLRQSESKFTIEIPRSDKPPRELLNDSSALKMTKKLLERRQRETLALQKVQHNATMALSRTAGLNEVAAEQAMQSILQTHQDKSTRLQKPAPGVRVVAPPTYLRRASEATLNLSSSAGKKRPKSAYPVLRGVEQATTSGGNNERDQR